MHSYFSKFLIPVFILASTLSANTAQAGIWDFFKKPKVVEYKDTSCPDLLSVPTLIPNSQFLEMVDQLGLSKQMSNESTLALAAYQDPQRINMILTKNYRKDQESEINKDIIKIQNSFKGLPFSIGVLLTASDPTATFYVMIENTAQRDLFMEKLSQNPEVNISSLKASYLVYAIQ